MRKEIEELRPKLKEILYDCAVELKATKAALYLLDGDRGKYGLVTEYGFRASARNQTDTQNPIVDRCGRGKEPFFVNGVGADPRFAEVLYEASSDRLLAVPLFARGQLIGYVDARDKAAKQPFEPADAKKAQQIAQRLVNVVGDRNLFGLQFISLSDTEEEPTVVTSAGISQWVAIPGSAFVSSALSAPASSAPAASAPRLSVSKEAVAPVTARQPQVVTPSAAAPATPVSKESSLPPPSERLATVIAAARTSVQSIIETGGHEELTEAELVIVREFLHNMLMVPGVLVASFTAFEMMGGVREVASKGIFTDDASDYLQSKLQAWLVKRRESVTTVKVNVQPPSSHSEPPITRARIPKVFTAPVVIGTIRGMYLTVGFAEPPDRTAHEMLASMLHQLQVAIEHSIEHDALALLRAKVVDTLLEPDLHRFPDLRRHSEAVAALSASFAEFLSMSTADVESVRTIGMLHDVGMRLLGYDRLYNNPNLGEHEAEILREHPVVGAALVEPLLGRDIARAILTHHLRVDGGGYPEDLRGSEISLATRIVQICDAYVAMTDGGAYRKAKSHPEAVDALQLGAGREFDAELVERFVEMFVARAV